jgi:hypothetical protein
MQPKNTMTSQELKDRVYDILDSRIRPRIDPKTTAGDGSATIQHAVNIALGNIAVLATNKSLEVAIDYLYDLQRKVLKGVTREMVSHNVGQCLGHFRTEIIAFREMHKLLDSGLDCDAILKCVQQILDTNAKEFDIEPGSELTPSILELISDSKPETEEEFMKRMFEFNNSKRKGRKRTRK